MKRRVILVGLAAMAATVFAVPAVAAYPDKPVTIIVPFPPGGSTDMVARIMTPKMSEKLGQPVVVENKPGATGAIGATQVKRSAPDGYTLLMALSSVTIIPEADKILERSPMYRLDQLVPIARFTADPTVLVVRSDSPWKTAREFMAYAKSKPGALTFGSSGNYGTMHVPIEMLKQASGTFMVHVPYTGAGPAVVGLLGGQVDAVATGPSTIVQHVKSGRLRALAHWGEGRLAALPDVPSLKELGYPIGFSQWAGLFAPAGTPEPIIARLRDVARKAAEDERVVRTILTAGTPIQYQDAQEFARFVAADASVMAGVVKRIGKQ